MAERQPQLIRRTYRRPTHRLNVMNPAARIDGKSNFHQIDEWKGTYSMRVSKKSLNPIEKALWFIESHFASELVAEDILKGGGFRAFI